MRELIRAARSLVRRPLFAIVVILTLGLGIGATSAIFSVIDAVLLKPLPYKDPGRLAMIWSRWSNFDKTWISPAEYFDYQRQSTLFADVAAWTDNGEVTITAAGSDPSSATAKGVTANLLSVLGVTPFLGRGFTTAEDAPNGPPAVMVGYDLWQRRWGGDPGLVGRIIEIDGAPVQVVGVLPRTFRLPLEFQQLSHSQIIQPMQFNAANPGRGSHCCYGIARLRPGVTIATMTRDLGRLADQWTAQRLYPPDMHFTAFGVSLFDEVSGTARTALAVLGAAVILLLLLASVNVANLVLIRADERGHEAAVRSALGAGAGRMVREALREYLLLGLAGGVVGLALAWAGVHLLVAGAPTNVPRVADISVDWRVALFTLGVALLTGLGCSIAPLRHLLGVDIASALRDGRGQSGDRRRRRARNLLIVAETFFAAVLLIGAGLLVRSFMALSRIDPGFRADHVLTMHLSIPATRYDTPRKANGFFREVGDAVRAIPGVTAAGFARLLPLATEMGDAGLRIKDQPVPQGQQGRQADWQAVSPGYFRTMGIPVVDGRAFDQRDGLEGAPVIAINQELAREYFPNQNPIGQSIQVGRDSVWRQVVAVIGDVHHNGLLGDFKRGFYIPEDQWSLAYRSPRRAMTLVVRTAGDPRAVLGAVRAAVRRIDAAVPPTDVATMGDVLASATQEQRFTMALMAGFALLALVLAAVGIYGVIAYSVGQRTREIGIRMALGANLGSVRRLVLRQGVLPALLGVGCGVIVSLGLVRFLRGLLYGVAPLDPVTFALTPLLLMAVAAASVLIPAVRASRVDPVEALRES
jgi:putative ABC transport system permease protein